MVFLRNSQGAKFSKANVSNSDIYSIQGKTKNIKLQSVSLLSKYSQKDASKNTNTLEYYKPQAKSRYQVQ
jgi:hypothetical protein